MASTFSKSSIVRRPAKPSGSASWKSISSSRWARLCLRKATFASKAASASKTSKCVNAVTGVGPDANVLTVEVDQPGDFSPYLLRLVQDKDNATVPDDVDPQLAAIAFSFKVECPSPFDCAPQHVCPPEPVDVPDIDYLAKDFTQF